MRAAASWVIRNKATQAVICETFESRMVKLLNPTKYEAVPILQYLQEHNRAVKEAAHR